MTMERYTVCYWGISDSNHLTCEIQPQSLFITVLHCLSLLSFVLFLNVLLAPMKMKQALQRYGELQNEAR